jgi:molecular chaperone GrpE
MANNDSNRAPADKEDPAAPATGPADIADDQLNRDIEQLRSELDLAKDRALRFQAELDNYRKRVSRQMEEERRYAPALLVGDLLPVVDNIERAIEAAEKSADAATLLEGFRMVGRQLQTALKHHHCEKIEALGQPFDPHLHQALAQQPSDQYPPNTVLFVAQSGYRMFDRVVRPAQVIVAAPPAAPGGAEGRGSAA